MQKLLQDKNVYIGKNLKRLRLEKGMSQMDMVTKIQLYGRNMSRATYAHIEQGVRNIYVSDLILIKEILAVSYDEIFAEITIEEVSIPLRFISLSVVAK